MTGPGGPERTGMDIHISSALFQAFLMKAGPLLLAGALGLMSGGGASTWWDVSGARAYKEAKAEELAAVTDLEREVAECRAQKAQVLDLLDGATLRADIVP